MLTTCPECRTTFRVTQEHLGLRRGLVRCGHCGVVFNAYDSLLAELVPPPDEPDQSEAAAPPFVEVPDEVEAPLAGRMAEEEHLLTPPDEPDQSEAAAPTPEATPNEAGDPLAGRVVSRIADEETSDSILLSELPTRIKRAPPTGRPRRIPQILAALLLGGLFLLQVAVFLRADLAATMPVTRPLLQTLCQPFNCVVPLPRQLDKSAIAASSLEHDAENKSRARLYLLLANRGGQAQTWPHIVLTLTDVRDAPVAQRVFAPKEYLAKGTRLEAGMAAGEEQEIRLDLDTGTLAATGYALDLAYR
ncbi:MAG: DUF3426 domain-containing protein [Gallionellaceae bacterium]|nr:DUF3426 domain-containing protein [Gallionellaceae bacterium]